MAAVCCLAAGCISGELVKVLSLDYLGLGGQPLWGRLVVTVGCRDSRLHRTPLPPLLNCFFACGTGSCKDFFFFRDALVCHVVLHVWLGTPSHA